jgi:alginate biosynthesis protein AlgK
MWELAFVGAGLARDAGASVFQLNRGDAIAGKPAPTFFTASQL